MESIKIISLGVGDKAGDERISDYGVQREKIVLYSLYLQYRSTQSESEANSWGLLQIQLKTKPERLSRDLHAAALPLCPALCKEVGGCTTSLPPPVHSLVLEARATGAGSDRGAPSARSLGARWLGAVPSVSSLTPGRKQKPTDSRAAKR